MDKLVKYLSITALILGFIGGFVMTTNSQEKRAKDKYDVEFRNVIQGGSQLLPQVVWDAEIEVDGEKLKKRNKKKVDNLAYTITVTGKRKGNIVYQGTKSGTFTPGANYPVCDVHKIISTQKGLQTYKYSFYITVVAKDKPTKTPWNPSDPGSPSDTPQP